MWDCWSALHWALKYFCYPVVVVHHSNEYSLSVLRGSFCYSRIPLHRKRNFFRHFCICHLDSETRCFKHLFCTHDPLPLTSSSPGKALLILFVKCLWVIIYSTACCITICCIAFSIQKNKIYVRRSFSALVLPFVLAQHQNSKGYHLLRNEVLCIFNLGDAKNVFTWNILFGKGPYILFWFGQDVLASFFYCLIFRQKHNTPYIISHKRHH